MKVNWKLLAKKLAGEANEKEQEEIHLWIQQNNENKQLYDMLTENWGPVNQEDEPIRVDVDKAWMNLQNRLEREQLMPPASKQPLARLVPLRVMRLAAAVALLLQVSVNLANDYFDHKHGIDTPERLGPQRVTQSGLLQPESVKKAMLVTLGIGLVHATFIALLVEWYARRTVVPVLIPDGKVSKQAMILDITDRKKMEETLEKSAEKITLKRNKDRLSFQKRTRPESANTSMSRYD